MAKKKVTEKALPGLKRALEIDESVLKKLDSQQKRYKARYKDQMEEVKAQSLKMYKAKIESLTKSKTETVKEFDEDIQRYRALVKELDGSKVAPKPTRTRKKK